jgi:hypothetical protein
MPIIIYDERDLCIRTPKDEGDICFRSHAFESSLCGRGVVDLENVCASQAVDERTFPNLNTTRVDESYLDTMIEGEGAELALYRADTTYVSADNITLDCSYHR